MSLGCIDIHCDGTDDDEEYAEGEDGTNTCRKTEDHGQDAEPMVG